MKSFFELYRNVKHRYAAADALHLFVEGGLVTAYYDDSATLARALGLVPWRASRGPTHGVKQTAFPVAVLQRNLDILKGMGLKVVVHGEIVALCRHPQGRNAGHVGKDTAQYIPTRKQIERATASVRATWDEGEQLRRAGVYAAAPVDTPELSSSDRSKADGILWRSK